MKQTRATLTFLFFFTGDLPSLSAVGAAFIPPRDRGALAADVRAGSVDRRDDGQDRARNVLGTWARQGAFR